MRRYFLGLSVATALLASLAVFAQSGPERHGSDAPGRNAGGLVIKGCLKSNVGPTGARSSTFYTVEGRAENQNAKPTVPSGDVVSSSGAPNRAASEPAPPTGTYSLSAPESIGLVDHVGQEVQLTGHMKGEDQPTGTTSVGGAHRTFEVSAVKMVAPKCP